MAAATVNSTCTGVQRSVYWADGKLHMINQQLLPGVFKIVAVTTLDEVIRCIKDMTVRGAPAIGAAGAFGMALHANSTSAADAAALLEVVRRSKVDLDASRPTAVNLMWATSRMVETAEALVRSIPSITVAKLREKLEKEANDIAEDDVRVNSALARAGAEVVPQNANVLHHCNTGALATVDVGTALGVIYECHKTGKNIHVWVDETRPRLQGSKLTCWELSRGGVPHHLMVDSASGILMRRGQVDVVLFGADRVASNGDVANKVGTYKVCVVGRENGVPCYACVPTSTIDLTLKTGDEIVIEERHGSEVTSIGDEIVAPEGTPVFNPAFDVTPHKYLTGIITEEGICYPPFAVSLKKAKEAAEARIAATRAAQLQALIKESS
jgi:methylthioribose-1-phosphate isomerase